MKQIKGQLQWIDWAAMQDQEIRNGVKNLMNSVLSCAAYDEHWQEAADYLSQALDGANELAKRQWDGCH